MNQHLNADPAASDAGPAPDATGAATLTSPGDTPSGDTELFDGGRAPTESAADRTGIAVAAIGSAGDAVDGGAAPTDGPPARAPHQDAPGDGPADAGAAPVG